MPGLNESGKKELSLSINPFNKPQEYSGTKAWANQICALIMLEPGTYPSMPTMGVGLGRYEYATIDTVKSTLVDEIRKQVSIYLPDVPLKDVEIIDKSNTKHAYVVLVLTFDENDNTKTVVVATEQVGKRIDFIVDI